MKNERVVIKGRCGLRRSKYCFNEERGAQDFPLSKAAMKEAKAKKAERHAEEAS